MPDGRGGSMSGSMGRDARIDVARGIALMMIFIDHIPGNVFARATLQAFGFNDAAEVFVFLAGLSAALAYGAVLDRQGLRATGTKVLGRVGRIYVTHLLLFVIAAAMLAAAARLSGDPQYLEVIALTAFETAPLEAALRALTLTFLPSYLDILPLYVVLLTAAPALLLLARIHLLVPLALSVALYAAAQMVDLNLPNYPNTPSWYFNPSAWQLLFVIGLTVGVGLRAGITIPRLPVVTVAAAAVVLFGIVAAAPWRAIEGLADLTLLPDGLLPAIDKTNLSLLRLANVLAQVWLVAALVPRAAGWLTSGAGAWLGAAGRKSLEVFALGIVLSFAGTIVLTETRYPIILQGIVTLAGIGLMLVYAQLLERRDRVSVAARTPARTGDAGRPA